MFDQDNVGWFSLAIGIALLLARNLIDPSKPGKPGIFTPEVRRMRMMIVGIGTIVLGLTMLFLVSHLPPGYSESPFYSESGHTNPNRLLGVSILWLMFSSLIGWQGVAIIQSRKQMVANQRKSPELVQPIDLTESEKQLQVLGWVFVVAGGIGILWAATNFISWAGH